MREASNKANSSAAGRQLESSRVKSVDQFQKTKPIQSMSRSVALRVDSVERANRRAQLKVEGKMPSALAGGTPATQNKANLFRIEYCVMRIAKRELKKQSQFKSLP